MRMMWALNRQCLIQPTMLNLNLNLNLNLKSSLTDMELLSRGVLGADRGVFRLG